MRKVEKVISNAFNNNVECKPSFRDEVRVEDGKTIYLLYDSKIAIKNGNELTVSACGHYTNTTKKRLNAILQGCGVPGGIYQKNFEWFYDSGDRVLEDLEPVPFESDMKFILKN